MSGAGVFTLVCFVGAGALTAVCVAGGLGHEDTTTVSGSVTAPCVDHAGPSVYADGEKLAGEPWISSPLGSGMCVSSFSVAHVPLRDSYEVRVAGKTRTVSRVDSDNVVVT
jgi:hypothetical protein